jgi:hypothetical protein
MTTAQERPMTEIPEPLEWTTRLDLDPSWDVPTAKKDLLVLSLRIDQRFSATRAILDRHDLKFTSIESRLTKIEDCLDTIDQRLSAMDKRFDSIDERLTSLERSASTSRLAIYVSGAIGILGIISQHITF